MKIWVPGANGLVGRAFVLKTGALGTSRDLDIGNFDACQEFVSKHPSITHIVNCAAFSEVDPAELRPEAAFYVNVIGAENLARLAKMKGLRFLHLSTDYVFDRKEQIPLKEDALGAPCNVYGKTKLEGEKRVFAQFPEACVLRTSWIFGMEGKNFVAKLHSLLATQKELRLVSDQISRPTYVFDLVHAILALLNASGLYHFANAGQASKYEFSLTFRKIAQELGLPVQCQTILPISSSSFPSLAKRPLYSALNTEKIEQIFPIRSWEESLREYLYRWRSGLVNLDSLRQSKIDSEASDRRGRGPSGQGEEEDRFD